MTFKDSDFSEMMCNIKALPKNKTILEAFPILANQKEFQEEIADKEKGLAWIIYCFDMDSPFVKYITDINRRMLDVALFVGYEKNAKGLFGEDVEQMLKFNKGEVNMMIIRYVQLFYNTTYTAVVTMFMQFIHISNSMAKSKEKGTERKDFDDVVELLEKYTKKLLSQQTNVSLHKDLYRFIERESMDI